MVQPYRDPDPTPRITDNAHHRYHSGPHVVELDFSDITVEVTWHADNWNVTHTLMTFEGDPNPYPLNQIYELARDMQPPFAHGGDVKFKLFLETCIHRDYVELSPNLFVPWHRVSSINVITRVMKKFKVRYAWLAQNQK